MSVYSGGRQLNIQSPDTRRDRRISARRKQIIEAAAHLFAEKGFHRTTTHDIALAADVSEGTLYNYFESKDELLLAIMELLSDLPGLSERFDDGVPVDAREFLVEMLRSRRRMIDQYGPMLQSVLSEILVNPELRQQYYQELIIPGMMMLTAHLQARIDAGQIRSLQTPYAVRLIIGLMLGVYMLEVMGDPLIQPKWEELSQFIAMLIYEGAAPRPEVGG
jgi:AcrR family transcriptional regulator